VATIALASTPWVPSLVTRLQVGAGVATLVVAALAYLFLGKGLKVGASLVSRPAFVPLHAASHAPHLAVKSRDRGVVGGGITVAGGSGGSGSAVGMAPLEIAHGGGSAGLSGGIATTTGPASGRAKLA